jgi:O-antigen ligase
MTDLSPIRPAAILLRPRVEPRHTLRGVVFVLLCAVTFMVPWEELLAIPGLRTGIFLVSAVALAVSAADVLVRFRIKRLNLTLLVLAAFIYWCFISLLWSPDYSATVTRLTTYVSLLLITWMIWEYADTPHKIAWLLRSYVLGCVVTLSLLLYSYVAGLNALSSDATRYTGGGLDQNGFALLIDIGIVVAAYLSTVTLSRSKYLCSLFILPASLSVLLTGSRAGAVGLVAALCIAFVISWSVNWKSVLIFGIAVFLLVWLVPRIVPEALISRIAEGTGSSTFIARENQWKLGLQLWSQVPFQGVGANAFPAAARAVGGIARVAHNAFVQILVDNGIIGAILMLIVWFLLARHAWRLPRRERFLCFGVGVVWAILALSLSLEYYKITWLVYAWTMVQPVALSNKASADVAVPDEQEQRASERGSGTVPGLPTVP